MESQTLNTVQLRRTSSSGLPKVTDRSDDIQFTTEFTVSQDYAHSKDEGGG